MKLATPRIQYAVPQTLEKRLEIAEAIRALAAQHEDEQPPRRGDPGLGLPKDFRKAGFRSRSRC